MVNFPLFWLIPIDPLDSRYIHLIIKRKLIEVVGLQRIIESIVEYIIISTNFGKFVKAFTIKSSSIGCIKSFGIVSCSFT